MNLIAFQDELIATLDGIHMNGSGRHRNRSHAAANRHAREVLVKSGFTEQQAADAVKDANDIWMLNLVATND
jgi:hypothetical protein